MTNPLDNITGKDISLQDDRILSVAWGLTPTELGHEVDMDPQHAVSRAKWLLRQRDVWTAVEQEAFAFGELLKQMRRIDKILEQGGEIADARMFGVMTKTIQIAFQALDAQRKRNSEELSTINDVQANAIREVVENAYFHAVTKFQHNNPGLDLNPLTMEFAKSLKVMALQKDMEAADDEIVDAEILDD